MNYIIRPLLCMATVSQKRASTILRWMVFSLLLHLNTSAQKPLSNSRYKAIADSAIRFFATKSEICYRFEERWTSSNTTKPIRSSGDIKVLKEQGKIYYRGSHHYVFDSLGTSSYEFVKSPHYFGVNVYSGNFYKDYNGLRKEKQSFGLNANERDILKPDSFLFANLSDARFFKRVSDLGDRYRLELKDTIPHVFKGPVDGYRFQNVRIYEISKKDYSLLAFIIQSSSFIDNSLTFGEASRSFTIYTESRAAIKQFVLSFEPFSKKNSKNQVTAVDQTQKKFPKATLTNASGQPGAIKKKLTLIQFWYKSCSKCVTDFSYLKKLQGKGLDIVVVNVSDSSSDPKLKPWMKKYNFTFLFGGSDLASRLNIKAFPTLFLIDENHYILYRHSGAGGSKELENLIDAKRKSNRP